VTLRREDHGAVTLLELDRPEARNALSSPLIDALVAELGSIAADDAVGCVVLAGAGPSFCAGADLKELAGLDDAGFASFLERYTRIGTAIRGLGRPVVAAVHGHAVAGGFELMCQCDLRIVARDATLRVGDLDIGLSPTGGLTHLLPRLVGAGRARLLLFAGEAVDGDEAVAIGLAERALVEPRTTLLDALRNRANPPLTGSKLVCDRGNCGACSMIVGGKLVYGCLQLAVDARGKEVRTVEGLQRGDELSAVQRAFCEKDASMCGFCTPGFVMAITHCLENHPKADLERIKAACAGNLCRCGTQPHVFEAALSVAKGGAK